MIPTYQVTEIKVDPHILARYENVANKTGKQNNWLKVLHCHQQNQDFKNIEITLKKIHKMFVLSEEFWIEQIDKLLLLSDTPPQYLFDLLELGFEDGQYLIFAKAYVEAMENMVKEHKLRINYAIAKILIIKQLFAYNKQKGSYFYRKARHFYQMTPKSTQKQLQKTNNSIRELYITEIKASFSDIDVTFDQYKQWQRQIGKKLSQIPNAQKLYQQMKIKWEQQMQYFSNNQFEKLDPRICLNALQKTDELYIDTFLKFLNMISDNKSKLNYLRRNCLNKNILSQQFLLAYQNYYLDSYEQVKEQYEIIASKIQSCEILYLRYLVRQFNKHLLEKQDEEYNNNWGDRVTQFRNKITEYIQKPRTTATIQKKHLQTLYEYWLDIQCNIIKHPQSVQMLFSQIPQSVSYLTINYIPILPGIIGAVQTYQLIKKIYKAWHHTEQAQKQCEKFIHIFGNVAYECQFKQLKKQLDNSNILNQQNTKTKKLNSESIVPYKNGTNKNGGEQIHIESHKRPREIYEEKSPIQQKIQREQKKRLHTDSGSTIFISAIPQDWKEADIIKIINNSELIQQIRLVDVHGTKNCYIQFNTPQTAENQCKNNKSGLKIQISRPPGAYDQSNTLFLCSLPQTTTEQKIRAIFGQLQQYIKEVRIKLSKEKCFAYVDFTNQSIRNTVLQQMQKKSPVIDSKKILIQKCDSDRNRTKKFTKVIIIKNLAFKAQQKHIQQCFSHKPIKKIHIPKKNNKSQGFAFVEFERFKDYQEALDMHNPTIMGRVVRIQKSDRDITNKVKESGPTFEEPSSNNKDNNYFQSLFK